MKNIAVKRISKDLRLLVEDVHACSEAKSTHGTESAVIVAVDADSTYTWTLKVKAPTDSIYGGADSVYQLSVLFSEDYPHEPPMVRFVTAIYSPLVTKEGGICDRMVRINWTPDQHVSDAIHLVLDSVFSQYKNCHENDVYPEARYCLDNYPQEFAERVRRGH
ncbi:ubiquitin-conjugating enzyme E2 [Trypanosoma rangeli]|uniref:Ubiquitin-conjugating enzyme E2 n=1 Tax=Trypanosoma rangeli TaxID=5698 RepID=A0A422MW82_TRYRA|nr:ubiquitin-conjugating enzyme E2 [Trypanosoma rangeli]RNE97463.1 ubiquitin-conjugating enzyme E2 [Trypanosoma rangeli]|eukprot:RNE97463.1 ubiquitin-conjugating enzyme E2 [Trypanosoma rangeli]